MFTPLFPENDGPIVIQQGSVGDCYLLAALDCIFNSGPKGYHAIKSLFIKKPHGVMVLLKHNDQSTNLNDDKLLTKYHYSYDEKRNLDVFFFNNSILVDIDNAKDGAITNCLAVKILEHLSSYYYIYHSKERARRSSLDAHSTFENRFIGSSSKFVAKLLGLDAHDSENINDIVKIKTICPEQPIYINILFGSCSISGLFDGRHALRIDKIIKDKKSLEGMSFF